MHRVNGVCQIPNTNYQQLAKPSSWSISEYSLQEENGVLSKMRQARSYTFSFFPDDLGKKDVELSLWQLPVANWKLECNKVGSDINTAIKSLQSPGTPW